MQMDGRVPAGCLHTLHLKAVLRGTNSGHLSSEPVVRIRLRSIWIQQFKTQQILIWNPNQEY